jgi:sulfonate transport system substrate-binding protein
MLMNDDTPLKNRRGFLAVSTAAFAAAWPWPWAQQLAQAAEAPVAQLRVGFQKSAALLVILKQQGWLEKRFPGTKINWIEFPAGPQLLEALAVGGLDFGMTGDSPPVFAQAAGKDIVYVGAELPKPLSSAILVKASSDIKTLADLKGRKIALQKGSSAHFLVARAVAKAGLQWQDITPAYLAPADARAAFERDSVDAWGIWDPYYAATEVDIKPRVLTNGVGLADNNSLYLASRELVKQHPGAILTLLAALSDADAYLHKERAEAVRLIAEFSGLGRPTVQLFLERRPVSPVAPLGVELVAEQQRIADTFFGLGLIPRRLRVADIVWSPGKA